MPVNPQRAITLLAHGSPDPRHREGVDALAGRVGRLAPGRRVHTAYLDHHPPGPADAATRAGSGVVVPVLLTPAYHARVDVPKAVAAMNAVSTGGFTEGASLGPHSLLLEAARELLAAEKVPASARTAVVLFAAGSSDSRAVASIDDTLAAAPPGPDWGRWAVAALDGGRSLAETLPALRQEHDLVVAVSFMVAEGLLRDRMAEQCAKLDVDLVAGAFSSTDSLARLALLRADQVVGNTTGGNPLP